MATCHDEACGQMNQVIPGLKHLSAAAQRCIYIRPGGLPAEGSSFLLPEDGATPRREPPGCLPADEPSSWYLDGAESRQRKRKAAHHIQKLSNLTCLH